MSSPPSLILGFTGDVWKMIDGFAAADKVQALLSADERVAARWRFVSEEWKRRKSTWAVCRALLADGVILDPRGVLLGMPEARWIACV